MTQSIQYMVKDLQGNLYGPADIPTLRAWIAQERLAPSMQVAPANTSNWVPINTLAVLASAFTPAAPSPYSPTASPTPFATASPVSPASPAAGSSPDTAVSPAASGGYAPAYPLPYGSAPVTNGMAITSLVNGLVSLGALVVCCPVALVPGILGLVFGLIAKRQIRDSGGMQTGEGMALAGIITSIISMVLVLLYVLFCAVLVVVSIYNSPK